MPCNCGQKNKPNGDNSVDSKGPILPKSASLAPKGPSELNAETTTTENSGLSSKDPLGSPGIIVAIVISSIVGLILILAIFLYVRHVRINKNKVSKSKLPS